MAGYVYKGQEKEPREPVEVGKPKRLPRESPHGIPGLRFDRGKWRTRVVYKGKPYELGRFAIKEEAVRAIQAKRVELEAADPDWLAVKPCGTRAAYKRHQRRGEPLDLACRRAENEYRAQRKKGNQAA